MYSTYTNFQKQQLSTNRSQNDVLTRQVENLEETCEKFQLKVNYFVLYMSFKTVFIEFIYSLFIT